MLIGNTIEIFFTKLRIMYGRAAFLVLPSIINLYSLVFTIFSNKFWTWLFLRPVCCYRNPGQKLVILKEVVLGVLPALLKTVKREFYLFDFSKVEDIDT